MAAAAISTSSPSVTFAFHVTLTPASTAAAVVAEQAFDITGVDGGLLQTDAVGISGPGSGNACGLIGARINSSNQLVLIIANPTAGALTHAAGVFRVGITRQ